MRTLLLAALFALNLGGAALAETFEFPSEAPVASATFPDTWKAEETTEGLQGFSANDEVAFYIELTDGAGVQASVDKQIKFLADNGVTVDPDTLQQSEDEFNGRPASFSYFDGTDESGSVLIGMYFIEIAPDTAVMVTNWASRNEDGSFDESLKNEMMGILGSIKPAGE